MTRIRIGVVTASVFVMLAARQNVASSSPASSALGAGKTTAAGPTCEITLPAPVHRPLPAVREITNELNDAFENSSTNCGILQGIGARMNRLVSVLDQVSGEQNLNAACGIAGGLLKELQALVATGQLDPIITPGDPEASPNVVDNMEFVHGEFCRNAGR